MATFLGLPLPLEQPLSNDELAAGMQAGLPAKSRQKVPPPSSSTPSEFLCTRFWACGCQPPTQSPCSAAICHLTMPPAPFSFTDLDAMRWQWAHLNSERRVHRHLGP